MDCTSLALQVAPVSYYCLIFFIGFGPKLGNTYYHITLPRKCFLYVSKTLPSTNYLYLYYIYGRKPVRFMCSHCCLCRRRPIPSRLNNELFDWPIGKTESQSEIVFKGQLGSLNEMFLSRWTAHEQ